MKYSLLLGILLGSITGTFGTENPKILVLGTAQDAGLPQIGCEKEHCAKARQDPKWRRLVTSLLIVSGNNRWMIDATPDIKEQIAKMAHLPQGPADPGHRPRLMDGIFLTHAHMGHYTGLLQLGPEAYNHSAIPVYGSQKMKRFLSSNGPWSLLVEKDIMEPKALAPDTPFPLNSQIQITPFNVPHREEFTDTFGYIIKGPSRSLLFIPDIDKWEKWNRNVEDLIAQVDFALLDGTFFADGEIPGRPMSQIPHPFIAESMARFGKLPEKERRKIVFIHLNHSNPAIDPNGQAARNITEAGMSVAYDGQIFEL